MGWLDFTYMCACASFHALPCGEPQAAKLPGKLFHMQCVTGEQIPARFQFGQHRRVPAHLCMAELGWQVTPRQMLRLKRYRAASTATTTVIGICIRWSSPTARPSNAAL
ncbi:MAG: hypothetical protein ACOH1V_13230 [Stenotrophomonas sp.]